VRFVQRGFASLLGAALVVVACAGKSVSHHGGDGDDDGGSAATSGSAGTSGSVMTGGSGGTAGLPQNPDCALPLDSGSCDAIIYRFGFDPKTGVCKEFFYGGCEGNANNFLSAQACYAACTTPGYPDMARCTTGDECTLTVPECCGSCAPAERHGFVAVNRGSLPEYRASVCDPIDTPCISCPPPIEPRTDQWFGATCDVGHCAVFDARETIVTMCVVASDCNLRQGLACCQSCQGISDYPVAISEEAILSRMVCAPETACDACQPAFPPGAVADCVDGRCVVDENLR
jgi:hypothetical protein